MAIDPICGMTVDEGSALTAERDGKTAYFCSDDCRQKFLSGPAEAKPEAIACEACASLPAASAPGNRSPKKARLRSAKTHLHLPDASRSGAGYTRCLPKMRHGAGTEGGVCGYG